MFAENTKKKPRKRICTIRSGSVFKSGGKENPTIGFAMFKGQKAPDFFASVEENFSEKNYPPLFLPFVAESFLLEDEVDSKDSNGEVKMDAKHEMLDDQDYVVVFGKEVPRCKARMKNGGGRCTHPAVRGYKVCRMHGANPKNRGGAPPEKMRGNLNGLKHGAYVKRLLNEEDHHLFDTMLESIRKDFDLNDSTDQMQATMAAFYYTKWHRAAAGGSDSAVAMFDGLIRKQLESLKVTRAQREPETNSCGTPAEWAVALLERVREAKRKGKSNEDDASEEKV